MRCPAELRELLIQLVDPTDSSVDMNRLADLLRTDPVARHYYRQFMDLHGRLEMMHDVPLPMPSFGVDLSDTDTSPTLHPSTTQYQSVAESKKRGPERHVIFSALPVTSIGWATLAGALVIAFLLGLDVNHLLRDESSRQSNKGLAFDPQSDVRSIPNSTPYVARLVSNTGPVWNASSRQKLESGAQVRAEESITLLEGIAQLAFDDGATLYLEGPAMVNIDSGGVPLLQYGKVLASLPWGRKSFLVKAAFGSVWLDADDAVGISVFGSELQVHVFQGEIQVGIFQSEQDSVVVRAGTARAFGIGPSGDWLVAELDYEPKLFASRFSLVSDLLEVSSDYVESVKREEPVAYWRFDEPVGGLILNEVSQAHALRMGGGAQIVSQGKNRCVEFGMGINSGYLLSEDTFDELQGTSYAVETWVKPNHFHWGTVAGLLQPRTNIRNSEAHGFLVELLAAPTRNRGRANSLRYLHRSPPGRSGGTSCSSTKDYEIRKWQHVVAVKDGSAMRLYVNGVALAAGKDKTQLSDGLTLVVGQLFSFEPVRPFVGQLDEMAIYNHALSSEEVLSHYKLLRE